MFCPFGHRITFSTGECYSMKRVGQDLYEYVYGCEKARESDE